MTNIDKDENILNWLNEEFPLDNNMLTDKEISDDENIDGELSGNDFILPYVDEVAEPLEKIPSTNHVYPRLKLGSQSLFMFLRLQFQALLLTQFHPRTTN